MFIWNMWHIVTCISVRFICASITCVISCMWMFVYFLDQKLWEECMKYHELSVSELEWTCWAMLHGILNFHSTWAKVKCEELCTAGVWVTHFIEYTAAHRVSSPVAAQRDATGDDGGSEDAAHKAINVNNPKDSYRLHVWLHCNCTLNSLIKLASQTAKPRPQGVSRCSSKYRGPHFTPTQRSLTTLITWRLAVDDPRSTRSREKGVVRRRK